MNTGTSKIADTKLRIAYLAIAGVLVASLAGCAGDASTPAPSPSSPAATSEESEAPSEPVDDSAVEADLVAALAVVQEALVSFPDAAQVVLSDSVTELTFAYGAVQAPYSHSEATEKVTGTVTITGGAFEISATSAGSGIVYTIDQDGTITQS